MEQPSHRGLIPTPLSAYKLFRFMAKHYIDNDRFEELILLYQTEPKKHEEELFSMFGLLIHNILSSYNFNVDFEDAKQECFLLILKTIQKFNPENGKAFNYFTTIIMNNLRLIYTKNKKYESKIEAYEQLLRDKSS
jgi:DNA-directed RNA polymerase specialized sigma subunit